jgi:hypothetical protein
LADSKESELPIIDERIEFRGTTFLRSMTVEALRSLDKIIVLQAENDDRLAVLIRYEEYLQLQTLLLNSEPP